MDEEAIRPGSRGRVAQGDVRREETSSTRSSAARSEFGGFDFIVNNAGILGEGRLHETTNEQWDELVAVT